MLQCTKLQVIVKSDHKNLRTTKELNGRQARWAEELCGYNFREHIKGKENKVADALSRRADYRENEETEKKAPMLIEKDGSLSINRHVRLKMVHIENVDATLNEEIKEATEKNTERKDLEIDEDGYKRFKGLIYVPKEKEKAVMERFHENILEGHQGMRLVQQE
jgi:hypothetical protein